MDIRWVQIANITSLSFECGYCGNLVASNKGYYAQDDLLNSPALIYICPHCAKPIFYHKENYFPDSVPGGAVENVPENVEGLYNEARKCISCSSFTASVLASRKLLMNLSVSQGAKEGLSFIEYVEYLSSSGYIPPNGKHWVDHIRKKGNEATHEICEMTRDDAIELTSFVEMLLKFIFEFPAKVPNP